MNKSWLEQQVQNEKLKKVQEEKKDGTIGDAAKLLI